VPFCRDAAGAGGARAPSVAGIPQSPPGPDRGFPGIRGPSLYLPGVDAGRWRTARSLFERALRLSGAEREEFLSRACASDPGLLKAVRELLERDEGAQAVEPLPDVGPPPAVEIEGYRIERPLGSGGMGSVLLARQVGAGFERPVAIKLVHAGLDSEEILARFSNERAVLAALTHEGIARLYDAGTTTQGRPWIAMEFVDGRPIDGWCDERALGVRARIELFLRVCEAVQHAHQALVLHRDLKPTNILVTAEGKPKLLDFGIAKVLSPEGRDATVERTLPERRMFTPAYASPEQARGEPVTTASDVYSLGVVLYVLLTGRKPFDTGTPIELARRGDPPRPSTAVASDAIAARARGTEPARLRRALAGDLDTILGKALAPESSRRYASVEQLALDLRRHLDGMTVLARPDAWTYRARKFAQRNALLVGSAAAIAIVFAAGLAASLVLNYRTQRALELEARARAVAERRFESLRTLSNRLVFDVHDALRPLPGTIAARELVVRLGLEYLDQLAGEGAPDAGLVAELAAGYRKIGEVLGEPDLASRGATGDALEELCKAEEFARRAVRLEPVEERRLLLARVQRSLGQALFASGRLSEARDEFVSALAAVSVRSAAHPDLAAEELACERGLAHAAAAAGDRDEARRRLEAALDCAERRCSVCAGPSELFGLAGVLDDLSLAAYDAGDLEGSLAKARESLDLARQLHEEDPRDVLYWTAAVVAANRASAGAFLVGRGEEAIALGDEALASARELSKRDPSDAVARRLVADALDGLGMGRGEVQDFAGGRGILEESCAIRKGLAADHPADVRSARELATSLNRLALDCLGLADFEAGRKAQDESIATLRSMLERWPERSSTREEIVRAQIGWAAMLEQLGRVDSLTAGLRRSIWTACADASADARAEIARLASKGVPPAGIAALQPDLDAIAESAASALASFR
jgi:tetratricopeptide (TPR) repeat protein/predicted Ser/Thr protein kinase